MIFVNGFRDGYSALNDWGTEFFFENMKIFYYYKAKIKCLN